MSRCSLFVVAGLLLLIQQTGFGADLDKAESFRTSYQQQILPLMKQFCLDCHSTKDKEGELDLEQFQSLAKIRKHPQSWQKVLSMLDTQEMPPEDSPQLTTTQKKELRDWVQAYLNAEAMANAGDPGPVILRRLNNAEYNYTISDLTGILLNPTREFPVDSAAGEGFTNTGSSLVFSPGLVSKYLGAGNEVAQHMVLLPDGIRFSEGATRREWTSEIIHEIRKIYFRHTGDLGDYNQLNRWSDAEAAQKLSQQNGKINLAQYLSVLVKYREQIINHEIVFSEIAKAEQCNSKYLKLLAEELLLAKPAGLLIGSLQQRFRTAKVEDVPEIVKDIQAWQTRLWKYNKVGHFGTIRPWQEAINPLSSTQEFRVKLDQPAIDGVISIYLDSSTVNQADNTGKIVWDNPRLIKAGRTPIRLQDVQSTFSSLQYVRTQIQNNAAKYLNAAYAVKSSKKKIDIHQIATKHGIETVLLDAWLSYLGISSGADQPIKQYLDLPMRRVSGYETVKGWGLEGQAALSVLSNSADQTYNVPGELKAHHIAMHPMPDHWVAAGWKSPMDGPVQITAHVRDAHSNCGNGFSWSLELRQGSTRRILKSGTVDLGGAMPSISVPVLQLKKNDLVSLVIGPRDNNHGCDLTEVDLTIQEQQADRRTWSLSADCADNIADANPHADKYNNEGVWHFYTDFLQEKTGLQLIANESLLGQWLNASDENQAKSLAVKIQNLLIQPVSDKTSKHDAMVYQQISSLTGPLISMVDPRKFKWRVPRDGKAKYQFGLQHRLIVRIQRPGTQIESNVSSILEVKLPAELFAGTEFVVTATVPSENTIAQVQVVHKQRTASDNTGLTTAKPILVHPESAASRQLLSSFAQHHRLFPPAMCYTKIVPVDEVVTLVQFHREDEHFVRLMLDESEKIKLDKLWEELRFVSLDAITEVTVLEQLLEFASQDGDPSLFTPLQEAVDDRASTLQAKLIASEDVQIQAIVVFASAAYRRPLSKTESQTLHQLYQTLRKQDFPHDQAARLLLSRILYSPSFLYRIENPVATAESGLVSDWELATRLSYFLWSTTPDEDLRKLATSGQLNDVKVLRQQAQRMLHDKRTRRMAIEFACQWLHIRDFDQLDEKSEIAFPEFINLREDMYEESILFFTDMLQNDGSILDILNADHAFVNEKLAQHYGLNWNDQGEPWQRIEGVKSQGRGGVLGMATFLAKQSGASRTSPILRGNWVSETLLGERLPRPPKDVPTLPESIPEGLTERQLIEQHTNNKSCAKCHIRIDPYGFALENYDGIGRFRQKDGRGFSIDTKTILRDGTNIEGIDGLRNYLLNTRRETFVKVFCHKLLGYSLGRKVQLSDEPLISDMITKLEKSNYRFSVAIEAIVTSRQFREIRGQE